jgi:hypothetical protein
MDLDPSRYGEEDRREIDPPIQVVAATWSAGGHLDWWCQRNAKSGGAACAVQTVGSGGSERVIFVL